LPDDKGTFNINIDSTGSSADVSAIITITRTNLPENLKFYLDSSYTQELNNYGFVIKKSDSMTKTVPVYWYWNGNVSDENDSLFIDTTISADISVTATIAKSLYETLLSKEYELDNDVDFSYGIQFIDSDECYDYEYECYENGNYCVEFGQQCFSNGNGLMMIDGTQNNKYPILYYRGNAINNNVIFANRCWLIVRTTETGGTKLIYNGEVNPDGSCSNYSGVATTKSYASNYLNAYINKTTYSFDDGLGSPVYVGYMYNDANNYHASGTFDATGYRTHLADNSIDQETGRHTQNLKNSDIKSVIDAWYAKNIDGKAEESLLEDTVWCADRSITSETFTPENYVANNVFIYSASTRIEETLGNPEITVSPSLTCNRDVDKFTVEDENGNGDLTHPIGMLTADEILMAGNTIYQGNPVITYLSIPEHYYLTLSPYGYSRTGYPYVFSVYYGELYNYQAIDASGIRPAISLGNNTYITSGNGSFETPYTVG